MTSLCRKMLIMVLGSVSLCLSTPMHAGRPVWTFTPLTPTSIALPANGTALVQYLVTNQSALSHRLVVKPLAGLTQITTGAGVCSNPFTLPSKGSSCTLSLQVNGAQLTGSIIDGPVVCEQGSAIQCYKPSPVNILNVTVIRNSNDTTLTESVDTLGLSVNDPDLNAALTGTPRVITIHNSGTATANDVACPTSDSTSITSIQCTGCGNISAGGDCQVTITPSSIESATPGDTNPTPISLSISGSNTNTLTPTVNVLTYGSVYQGGYIYAVDDTTPSTGSIGGKVVTQANQASGAIWSSNGRLGSISYNASLDIIPYISDRENLNDSYDRAKSKFNEIYSNTQDFPFPSEDSFLSCVGATDGSCNSANILTLYRTYITNYYIPVQTPPPYTLSNGPTPITYYAAGLCSQTISGYSDWYLPAICEMGPHDSVCPLGTQNMVDQLPGLIGDPNAGSPGTSCTYMANCLAGSYWSSTEQADNPQNNAWFEHFDFNGSFQSNNNKSADTYGVRCSRELTL